MTVSSDTIANKLNELGFLRSVAGTDFDLAVKAIGLMFAHGRGLFVTGAAGCGKTRLLTALKEWLNKPSPMWFYCKDSVDMANLRTLSNESPHLANVYVDDIGSEEIVKEYGNTVDVVGDFIQRYHYRGTGRLMATTNLTSKTIVDTYGMRTLDRILELCVVLKMKGTSKRERIIVEN